VIAIASGKGGVGKSSITTNLAIALAQEGKRVAAVDADVWGFSMPRMLGVKNPPDVEGEKIIPPVAHGVTLMSMGYFAREDHSCGAVISLALEFTTEFNGMIQSIIG
jgi:ATP-binding protein involved in chromosome partitioning